MAIDRTQFNALVDDDGSGTTGTPWNKARIAGVVLDPVDAAINPINAPSTSAHTIGGPLTVGGLIISTNTNISRTTADDADTGFLTLNGGGGSGYTARGAVITVSGNERVGAPGDLVLACGNVAGSSIILHRADGGVALTMAGATGVTSVNYGLAFPATQVASSDANTLDDYEEGNWMPVILGSSGQSGQSYSHQVGTYTKTGRTVALTCSVQLSILGTISGGVRIGGLPYPCIATFGSAPMYWNSLTTGFTAIMAVMPSGMTHVDLWGATGAVTSMGTLLQSHLGNSTHFVFSLTYPTS